MTYEGKLKMGTLSEEATYHFIFSLPSQQRSTLKQHTCSTASQLVPLTLMHSGCQDVLSVIGLRADSIFREVEPMFKRVRGRPIFKELHVCYPGKQTGNHKSCFPS